MSSADNRPVATDATATIGTVIDERAGRDAIHIAVEPVVAGADMARGGYARVVDGVAYSAERRSDAHGIVDPFLDRWSVKPGQRFWLVLFPRTITSLRHVWSHPAFPEEEAGRSAVATPQSPSERWLRSFCDRIGERYEYVMAGAAEFQRSKKSGRWPTYLYGEGDPGALEGEYVPDEFWDHYQSVTGDVVDEKDRESFFTCSC